MTWMHFDNLEDIFGNKKIQEIDSNNFQEKFLNVKLISNI